MSLRVSRNLSTKEKKVYTFENFRGVDFSTSPFKVVQNRATFAQNLVYKDGLVRKRNGWESLLKFEDRINGLFSFELNDDKFILIYSGKKFFLIEKNEQSLRYESVEITDSCSYLPASIDESKLIDRRIQLYVNRNKAYIIGCGDYLVFGKYGNDYELRRVVDNEDTFIPTTTINIDADSVNDENRSSFDPINLLSSFRKNEMVGLDAEGGVWTVDTAIPGETQAIDLNSDILIKVNTYDSSNNKITKEVNNRISDDKSKLYFPDSDTDVVGSVNFSTGKITLNFNTKPQEADTSNIIITFKKTSANQSLFIENASLSILFGGGGSSNRLFVAGYSEQKNIHRWSELYDFTYFPDTNYDEIGNDSSAIVGYVRATDGILLVFKEKNGSDATIYYVSGTDTEETDYQGNINFITKFNKYAGNISDTIFGKYATASLNGDNLILTKNGVKGLALSENLVTSSYRVQERSRNINNKLLKEDKLEDACGFVYQDKYFLSVNDVVYVCDSAFNFTTEADIGSGFNYEWWYFTNINARVWCEIDNKLYFGTNDGKICVFSEDFADKTYQYIGVNNLSILMGTEKIAYNCELDEELKENDIIEFVNAEVFALYIDADKLLSVDEDGKILFEETQLPKIYEGLELYVDQVENTSLNTNTIYVVDNLDLDNLTFNLKDVNGQIVIPSAVGFRLCKKISKKKLYITEINHAESEFKVREFLQSEVLDLVAYNNQTPTQLCAYLCFKNNVLAIWQTPVFDMGSNMYSKTLFGITISTEPLMKGSINVGYQTRNIEQYFSTKGNRGFDFEDIDFEEFSFEGSFANSNTIRCKERNFNYIVLRYTSDNQSACAVNEISIRYKINRLNKGVR